jgi:hypothetical protein
LTALVLAEYIAFSFARRAQPLGQVGQGRVMSQFSDFRCESLHKRRIARIVRGDKLVY